MSSSGKENQIFRDFAAATRRHSTATVVFHRAIAESIGLSASDHKYLDVLVREGPMPAGRLAEITGLTTGAVTGLIDRLEKTGLVRREKDPSDRRKVIVQPLPEEGLRRIGPAFEHLASRVGLLCEAFDEDALSTILEYLNRATLILEEATRELQSDRRRAGDA